MEEGPIKWGSRTFDVIRQPSADTLQPHEQVFLEAFFKKAKNERVALTDIASIAYNSHFTKALDQELTSLGWRDGRRSARRSRFLLLTILGLTLGMVVLGAGLLLGGLFLLTNTLSVIIGAILLGVGAASSSVSLVGLIVAAVISSLSEEGLRQASAWNSFTGYLRNITRGKEASPSPDIFERYLPYAAGFGIATEWTKYFQKVAGVPVPEWFQSIQSSVEDGNFAAILAAVTAADSSASAAASAGAGGASGGGASGAG